MICRRLNKYVDIYQNTEVDDNQGGGTPSWSKLATVPVEIHPARGTRALVMGQELNYYPFEITMRNQTTYNGTAITFNEDYLIKYESKYIVLHSVIDEPENGKYLLIFGYEKR